MINKKQIFTIILVITSIFIIIDHQKIYAAITNISSIATNNGEVIGLSNGTIKVIGGPRMTITGVNQTMTISSTGFQQVSALHQVRWNTSSGTTWFNYDFTIQNNDPVWVGSNQPYSGTIISISITPVYNTLSGTITANLFNNGIFTGKSFIMSVTNSTGTTIPINLNFNAADNLEWQFSNTIPDNRDFVFNFQSTINYNG